jgi:hypothetical protein
MVEEGNFSILVWWKKKKRKKIAILILISVKFPNFDFGPWTFLSFHPKKCRRVTWIQHDMCHVMSLNRYHIMVFVADRSNERLKPTGLNFTRVNWLDFFLQRPKFKLKNFTGTKSTLYPNIKELSHLCLIEKVIKQEETKVSTKDVISIELDILVGCSLFRSVWSVLSCWRCFLLVRRDVFGNGVFCERCFYVASLQFHCSIMD